MNDIAIKTFTPRAVRPHELMDDEIDLRELFTIVWSGKWLIVLTTLLSAVLAIAYALHQPNTYRSEALLAPNMGDESSSLSRMAGQFGGLASLAGVDLGGSGADKKTVALEVLKSRVFLTDFISRHQLEVPLIAAEGWDMKNQRWEINPERYTETTTTWVPQELGKPGAPTDWDLVKAFKSVLSVNEDKTSGMVRVAIETRSPEASRDWAAWLVADLNEHMRLADIEDARRSIAYLESELDQTNNAGMQQVFYQLIEQQTRTMMLARVRDEYSFKTVDPAVVPQEKAGPKRALMVILGVMLGGMLGLFAVFVRHFIRNQKDA